MQAFKTKAAVNQYLDSMGMETMSNGHYYMPGHYELAQGEYDRPEFKAVRYQDGWGIKAIYFYYQGTLDARKDGRVDIYDDEDYGLQIAAA